MWQPATVQVHVYDVDKNIMGPMCTQKIARKAKLTKLAFNPRHPIIAVGEEKCAALKLISAPYCQGATSHCMRRLLMLRCKAPAYLPYWPCHSAHRISLFTSRWLLRGCYFT